MEALTKSLIRPPLCASALTGQPSVAVKASSRSGPASSLPSVSKAAPSNSNRSSSSRASRIYALPNDDDVISVTSGKSLEELEETIRRIAEENEQLRARAAAAAANARATEAAYKGDADVTRPRRGAVPPPPPPDFVPAVGGGYSTVTRVEVAVEEAAPVATESFAEEAMGARSWQEAVEVEEAATSAAADGSIEISAAGGIEVVHKTENPMSIVFVASEVAPYSKTGGLADVVGSLPVALAARGHRVMVVAPRYMNGVTDKLYAGAFDMQCRIKCFCFEGAHEVAFFHEFRDGVDFVFVDHPSYHRPGTPYGDQNGTFGDNQFRFTLLCHAACEAPLQLELGGFTYGEKVLFIANDWHAGLLPVLVASNYRPHGVYKDARTILAIHNLSHQGVEPGYTFGSLGVPGDWYGSLEWVFPEWARKHELDKGEAVNILKGAIVTADRIVTVSPGYAWEITTVEGGWGLDGLLRGRSFLLNGVTNGVDVVDWNPATDKHIPSQYTAEDMSGKAACKAALQQELGLPVRPDVPLIGFIGRLDWQKGPDVIQAGVPEMMTGDVQFIMLGSGDAEYESWMAWAESEYRDKFRGWVGFSVPVAHRMTAGCDILLMPSRFEPCGLNQLYAMRYGTIPVVHATGGLRDTVEDFNPFANEGNGAGTGWTFSPLTKEAMMGALWTAIQTYREHRDSWTRMMERGMLQDMSWNKAAEQYEQIFQWAMLDKPYA
ncbi:hypothetical protein CLOM_g16813 [Closterium sp. NIES-68]|nr:hypothetical protein CLOM_g16813 [Closterium sp. NIES-68]GJP75609.1 hypothetical protein CLOP_g6038 [Closterium sp. NIES-67]